MLLNFLVSFQRFALSSQIIQFLSLCSSFTHPPSSSGSLLLVLKFSRSLSSGLLFFSDTPVPVERFAAFSEILSSPSLG